MITDNKKQTLLLVLVTLFLGIVLVIYFQNHPEKINSGTVKKVLSATVADYKDGELTVVYYELSQWGKPVASTTKVFSLAKKTTVSKISKKEIPPVFDGDMPTSTPPGYKKSNYSFVKTLGTVGDIKIGSIVTLVIAEKWGKEFVESITLEPNLANTLTQ